MPTCKKPLKLKYERLRACLSSGVARLYAITRQHSPKTYWFFRDFHTGLASFQQHKQIHPNVKGRFLLKTEGTVWDSAQNLVVYNPFPYRGWHGFTYWNLKESIYELISISSVWKVLDKWCDSVLYS